MQQRVQQTDAGGHLVWVVSELPAITRETYDGLGRLREVRDALGTLTHYGYDVGGRLDGVLSSAGGKGQVRSFIYDGRGFLVREVSPEAGAVSYRYDARGHVTQRSDAAGPVFSVYDAAGRLVHVSTPSPSGAAPLRDFEYDTAANGIGKLAVAHAYNWRSADSCSVSFEVRQDLSYDPGHGRLSSEVTTLLHGSALEKWTQAYAYDGAGDVTTTTYSSCLSLCPATPRSATTIYGFGRPTSVPGFAPAISYWPNGTVASITHQNQVKFAQTPDPTGMERPKALGIQNGVPGLANPWQLERYYRPLFGRLLSPDRGPGRPLLPQSWNRYAYVRDNPLALVDPNGQDDIAAIATGVPTGFKIDWGRAGVAAGGVAIALAAIYAPTALEYAARPLAPIAVGVMAGGGGVATQIAARILGDENKMNHIFENVGHNLGELTEVVGSEEGLVTAVSEKLASLEKIPTNSSGLFSVYVSIRAKLSR